MRNSNLAAIVTLVTLTAIVASAQPQTPSFDVASVKPLKGPLPMPGGAAVQLIRRTPTSLTAPFVPVIYCIAWAYAVPMWQISGLNMNAPPDFYEIMAKTAEPRSRDEMRVMLQALLVDRFHLKFHRETKSVSGYALVVSKKMPLEVAEGDAEMTTKESYLHAELTSITMAELAMILGGPGDPPVVDMTGLSGRFNLKVDIKNYLDGPAPRGNGIAGDRDAFMRALPDQLGLKLEGRKVQVEMFVVDHVEKPTEN